MTRARDYTPVLLRYGAGGLDLRSAVDAIKIGDYARLTNVVRDESGGLTTRPGLLRITDVTGTTHHSITRLNDPRAGTWTRVWGIDTSLYTGPSGTLTVRKAGFSGDPLTLTPFQPVISGETWMYVGDRTQTCKIRSDGLTLPIGLPAPVAAVTTALATELTVAIEQFEGGFAAHAGTGGAPALAYVAGKVANALQITTALGAATTGYYNYADKANGGTIDLTTFGGGVASTDDDFIHLWLKVDQPAYLDEVRLYLICSAFTAGAIPGTSATQNTDAFLKAFVSADITNAIEVASGVAQTLTAIEQQAVVEGNLPAPARRSPAAGVQVGTAAARDATRLPPPQLTAGQNQWTEYGIIGIPVRKGDFRRIGSDGSRGWATITGVSVLVKVKSGAGGTLPSLIVTIDDLYLRGGRGPDSADPGQQPYDVRYTNYDPRTGAEGNPSPEQATTAYLDSLRRRITATPAAYGDAAIRQRFYRRGGSLTDDWFFEGVNTSDGGAFQMDASDDTLSTGGTLALDHDQAVSTVDALGTTIHAQPVPVFFGPVQGMLLALGDPYRPGDVYWSIPNDPDSWPPGNHVNVCAPSEELLNGGMLGTEAFAFSRRRLHALIPNLSGVGGGGNLTAVPTTCGRGLAGRWAMATGYGFFWFVDHDGIFRTDGGPEQDLTDARLRPIFQNETVEGIAPIDFSVPTALRVTLHRQALYVLYQGTDGQRYVATFHLLEQWWRIHRYGRSPAVLTSEEDGANAEVLLVGGATTGVSYQEGGVTDDSLTIACQVRTGALDHGQPQTDKSYGQYYLDVDGAGATLVGQILYNAETQSLPTDTITTLAARTRYYLNPFGLTPLEAQNVSYDLQWGSTLAAQPRIYFFGIDALLLPDTSITRLTEWDDLGRQGDKYLTGVTLEFDTLGGTKAVLVEYTTQTGAVLTAATIAPQASRRARVTFSWPGVVATLVRLRPTDGVPWKVFEIDWRWQPEPLLAPRWETPRIALGHNWQIAHHAELLLRSTAEVTLTLTAWNQEGVAIFTQAYAIPSTTGARAFHYVPFQASKGMLYQAVFTSPSGFALYDLIVYLQRWMGGPLAPVHVFGDSQTDLPYTGLGYAAQPGAVTGDIEL